MDPVPILSTIIFVATVATMILAVFSYAAFKLREKRGPAGGDENPIFFRRFELPAADEEPGTDPG